MNDDERLAAKTREAVARVKGVREVRMFGGVGFMLDGNLLAGAATRGLRLRMGAEATREALSRPGARPMVMRGRAMKDYAGRSPTRWSIVANLASEFGEGFTYPAASLRDLALGRVAENFILPEG